MLLPASTWPEINERCNNNATSPQEKEGQFSVKSETADEGGAGDGEDTPHERKNATGLIRQVEKRKDKDKGSQRRRKGRSRVAQESGGSRQQEQGMGGEWGKGEDSGKTKGFRICGKLESSALPKLPSHFFAVTENEKT